MPAAKTKRNPDATKMLPILLPAILCVYGCGELPIRDERVTYVAFGNSTTDGPTERDYPTVLREMRGDPPESWVILSAGGETTTEGLERLQNVLAAEIYPNAEVWFFWEGGGDLTNFIEDHDPFLTLDPTDDDFPFATELVTMLENVQRNISSAVQEIQDSGAAAFVATLYPVTDQGVACPPLPLDLIFETQAVHANRYVDLLNSRIRDATVGASAALVDIATIGDKLLEDPANYVDCNHLSGQGNVIVAEEFQRELIQVE